MAMGFTRSFALWVFWNFAAGLSFPFSMIPTQSYMQTTVPDDFRGRVQSVSSMIAMGVQPIGLSIGGILLERVGLGAMFAIMGGGMILAVFIGLTDREFRESRLPDAKPLAVVLESDQEAIQQHA